MAPHTHLLLDRPEQGLRFNLNEGKFSSRAVAVTPRMTRPAPTMSRWSGNTEVTTAWSPKATTSSMALSTATVVGGTSCSALARQPKPERPSMPSMERSSQSVVDGDGGDEVGGEPVRGVDQGVGEREH